MKEAFALINLDTDNCISLDEFSKAMAAIGIDAVTATQLFNRFDPDGNGQLDTEEFFAYAAKGSGEVRALIRKGLPIADDVNKILEVFQAWDTDGDGTISRHELEHVLLLLNPSFARKDVSKVMKAADRNGDGFIDYQEFTLWLTTGRG